MVWFADVTVESRPMMISSYTVPEASGSFCERGGRFGSHSSNESMAPVYYKKMAFIAFFNAGVRALDIRDPYHPTEVGYFIPSITAATDKRCVPTEGEERCKVAIQTNNVETDERGYIYIVDRANTGMHILELTGDARKAAGTLADEHALAAAIVDGAALRVRPIMMTACVVIAGLLPIMWSSGTGSEVMRRIAAPMMGGMITALVLSMFVVPVAYLVVRRLPMRSAEAQSAKLRVFDSKEWVD